MARSPPANMSNQRKQPKEEKSTSETSCDEEELTPVVKNRKQSFEKVSNKKNLNKVRKNLHSEEEKQKSRQKTGSVGKKTDEKLKKGKKGRKKKNGGETSTSSSDENKKNDDSVSSSSSEDSSTSSEEDEKEEKNVRNRKSFGQKGSTVAAPSTTKRQSTGVNKKSSKRSGEYEGLDGGEKINIFTNSTTTTSRHLTNQDVAKVRDKNESAKMRLVAASKVSSSELVKDPEETGILNRAIDRLFELRQSNDKSKIKTDDREANDADVEDEVDEKIIKLSDKISPSNGKVSLNFESPTKKLKKRSPESGNRRFRRAAASKASDRIARESRGSINLDSSSSSDSEDFLSKNKIDKKKSVETSTNKLSAKKTSSSTLPSTSIKPTVTKSLNSKLDIFSKKLERVVSKAEVVSAIVPHSDSSDFEDENVTLASKFKKGVKSLKKVNVETKLSVNKKTVESASAATTASKRKREEDSGLSDDIDVGKKKQQQQISNAKNNVSGKKPAQDQEKENQFNREPVVANGKNLSWPEQLARSKAARSGSRDKRRLSFEDSADSADPDRIISESAEPKQSSAPIPKKAIILPILGKHHKEAMLRAAAAKEDQVQKISTLPEATTPTMKGSRPTPSIISPEVATKKRGPGRPRKADTSINAGYEIFLLIGETLNCLLNMLH